MKNSVVFLLLSIFSSLTFASEEVISKYLTTIEQPSPIKRVHPKYPKSAAMQRREGWVKLSFIIEEDGTTSNVVVNESSGSKDFDKAAKRAVTRWQYEPAYENGKPIQQCANSVQLDFRMNKKGQQKVTKTFYKNYQEAVKALSDKNLAIVQQKLAKLDSFKYRHLSENNYYHLLAADYQKELGNQQREFFHLSRTRFHQANDKLNVYNRQFWLAIKLNLFKQAYYAFERIKKLDEAKPYLASFEEAMAKIDLAIASKENIAVEGNIENQEFWHYNLVRKSFSISNVTGKLTKLDVRCANKRHIYTIEENNTWTIPDSWNNCDLLIYGEDNSQFNLIEHPRSS